MKTDRSVGIRELKSGLSAYLRRVRRGEALLVTDRGAPIARIVPARLAPELAQLLREGKLTWPERKPVIPTRPLRLRGRGRSAAEMVLEDRG
jgi:prevent-host-death family protein